jgi:hypothetical protein
LRKLLFRLGENVFVFAVTAYGIMVHNQPRRPFQTVRDLPKGHALTTPLRNGCVERFENLTI